MSSDPSSESPPALVEATDPLELFRSWYAAAEASEALLPDAVTLATATPEGVPSARMVLLKGVDERGFAFYTNYDSNKARDLDANPRAALCFHWASLQRQVRVSGPVQRVGAEESGAYFATRPRGSRIGAWASQQSRTLADREELTARVREYEERFAGGEVPLPPFWGGYRVVPERIEFWQGRTNRLHDRMVFTRTGERWTAQRLYP